MKKMLVNMLPLRLIDLLERGILNRYEMALKILVSINPDVLEQLSRRKAIAAFRRARKQVPAYKDFLKKNNAGMVLGMKSFTKIPPTSKDNYVKAYSCESRCVKGKLPEHGTIDESAGSSGYPINWVRAFDEERMLDEEAKFEYNYVCGQRRRERIVISTWSSGPWSTDLKFCEMMEKISLVKNIGTDVADVVKTINTFGNKYSYLIAGYPPFITKLIDEGSKSINWSDYRIDLITGGEGVLVEWPDMMRKKLGQESTVLSSYGCSDVDIGVGFETPICTFIRKLAHSNRNLARALFMQDIKTPMVFQYNPSMHYIENHRQDSKNDFLITTLDRTITSPRVRYDVNDEGGVIPFKDMMKILYEHEPEATDRFLKSSNMRRKVLKTPFLYVTGRIDGTISLDGANVYPQQIDRCLIKSKELITRTSHSIISREEDEEGRVTFRVFIELRKNVSKTQELKRKYQELITEELPAINADYRESITNDARLAPRVTLFKYGTGPFRDKDKKVKLKRILTDNKKNNKK